MEVIFTEVFQGEKSFVDALTAKIKNCGVNETIHVKFEKWNEGKQVFTPKGEPEYREVDFNFLEVCEELRQLKSNAFVTFDNVHRMMALPVQSFNKGNESLSWRTKRGYHFLGEAHDTRSHISGVTHRLCARARVQLVKEQKVVEAIIPFNTQAELSHFMTQAKDLSAKVLSLSGMIIQSFVNSSSKSGKGVEVIEKLFVTDYNIYDDSFKDVTFLDKIKTPDDLAIFRDYGSGRAIYADEVNELMWYNVFFSLSGFPVFNLVLTGPGSIAKTSCLRLYQAVFGDPGKLIIQTEGSTVKGLLPSFTEPVKNGELIDARFFLGVDELFRSPASDAHSRGQSDIGAQTSAYLSKLLPVLTRSQQGFASGKGGTTDPMVASLMATDNLIAATRVALKQTITSDPATLRRILIVKLGRDQEWENLENAELNPSEDELVPFCKKYWQDTYGYNLTHLKRLAIWARKNAKNVQVSNKKCTIMSEELVKEILTSLKGTNGTLVDDDFVHKMTRRVPPRLHFVGAVKCAAVTRTICASKKLPKMVKILDEDYDTAKRVLYRPLRDMYEIFLEDLEESTRAIQRV